MMISAVRLQHKPAPPGISRDELLPNTSKPANTLSLIGTIRCHARQNWNAPENLVLSTSRATGNKPRTNQPRTLTTFFF